MSTQGIKITDLRAEVQTLVNSDPVKYDPNGNGYIDEGVELSQLLSEYQCKAEDLTSDSTEPMWTLNEQIEIREKGKEKSESAKKDYQDLGGVLSGLGVVGTLLGFGVLGAGSQDGHIVTHKKVDIEKLVSDGSYTKGARPAYDFDFGKMKNPITEADVARFDAGRGKNFFQASTAEELNGHITTRRYARDLNGKPFTLRNWKIGDPQYVKTGTNLVAKYIPTSKLMTRVGLVGAGVILTGILTSLIGSKIAENKAENEVKTDIKAAQTAEGERIMQERIKHEEEMRQREAALKAEELEYRERMQNATKRVENHVHSAEIKARNINKELKEAEERKLTAPADSIQ